MLHIGFLISVDSLNHSLIYIVKIKTIFCSNYVYHISELVGAFISVIIIWAKSGLLFNEGIHILIASELKISSVLIMAVEIIGFNTIL